MRNRLLFDHYRICLDEEKIPVELGRGALATTYLAEDINLKRKVALKVIDCATLEPETRRAFEREARAAALLRQRNVATVHHLGTDDAHFFYAMEYVEGQTAEACVFADGPMEIEAALDVALQVSRALAAAARKGLTHGDIKPANLMISPCPPEESETPLVKVIDFGLATATHSEGVEERRPQWSNEGAANFASPEQLEGRALDIRSDIYSLGCTLWFLLTGEPPFDRADNKITRTLPLNKLKNFPRSIRQLLIDMLAADPDERVADPLILAERIQFYRGQAERKRAAAYRLRAPLRIAEGAWALTRPHARAGVLAMFLMAAATAATLTVLNAISDVHPLAQPKPPTASATEPPPKMIASAGVDASATDLNDTAGAAAPNARATASPNPGLHENYIVASQDDDPAARKFASRSSTSSSLAPFLGVTQEGDWQVAAPGSPGSTFLVQPRPSKYSDRHHRAASHRARRTSPVVAASRRVVSLLHQ